MAACWHNDLFQLVGSDSVLFVILMTGACCIRGKPTYSRMSLPIARLQAMSYDTKGVVKNALLKYPSKYLLRLTFSSSRSWLFRMLQSVVVWVADTKVTQAAETEKKRLRSQVTGLEKQTLATEGQVRGSVGRLPITRSYDIHNRVFHILSESLYGPPSDAPAAASAASADTL
ncbi:hypothetical protein PENPOL_c001G01138 [Penicillium polonicum]|uniref:Uncharacterized protein n=1 Tax=Penicillium polonicum TaxID=60169 RepID=A0A1V6P292_PENPO|nr:hypothetical protein PENPOL_c001G01138 [Penicillium polonicum]